ncbi:hypothetical protein [Gangjinia marincola]
MQTFFVILAFILSIGYLITKFIWKPSFLSAQKDGDCGSGDCGCH